MKTNYYSHNPFITGLKPKTFLLERLIMLREEIVKTPSRKKFNPNWNKTKKAA
jgi:hypothetical protein